jgi:hypothetical protein
MRDRAIFLGGLDRSGKTYMRLMLNLHPNLALTRRTDLWPRFYGKFGSLDDDRNLGDCLRALEARKHIRSLGVDLQSLRADFVLGERSYPMLFALIHRRYAQRTGKGRWGDQSELIERYAGPIFAAYPAASFIHMVRDPRDRYEAVRRKSARRGGVGAATARWLYSVSLAEDNSRQYPDRYLVVRYESMVMRPEETMREVCAFIDENFRWDMIQMAGVPRFSDPKRATDPMGMSPLSPSYVGRFRGGLSPQNIDFIQRNCEPKMGAFDYPLEPVRFSWRERARSFAVDRMINSLWMMGWQMRIKAGW